MPDITSRIQQSFDRLQQELFLLWIFLGKRADERLFLLAHQQLLQAQRSIDRFAQDPATAPEPPALDDTKHFLDSVINSVQTTQLIPDASVLADEGKDALIRELALVLHHLCAPATLQGPVNSYQSGLTTEEILYLLREWNNAKNRF